MNNHIEICPAGPPGRQPEYLNAAAIRATKNSGEKDGGIVIHYHPRAEASGKKDGGIA